MAEPHILLLTFPAQGHINPTLRFAKRLIRTGARVTFATSVYGQQRVVKSTAVDDQLSYASFSDGYDDGLKPNDDFGLYLVQFKEAGSRAVSDLIRNFADDGRPVTTVVYTILLYWAADVSRTESIPSVLLWIQPAAVLTIYSHCFHSHTDLVGSDNTDPDALTIEIPGLPLLAVRDLPSFITPPYHYPSILSSVEEHFRVLDEQPNARVLVNTFDALEGDVMKAVDKLEMIGIGPLIPQEFLDRKENSGSSSDLVNSSRDYIEWLDSKPASSVVYVSFGTILVPSEHQMGEILNGLLESGHPFLWVIRSDGNGAEPNTDTEFWKKVSAAQEGTKQGLVVPWCSQVEVLSHPSVGCFVSHCGWNSTMESLAVGVPMVGFPHWTDQPTIMKMVESVWKMGVRVRVNEDNVLEGGELKRCLDLVMGGKEGEAMKKNALRWRELAGEAVAEGGSSDKNIRAFAKEMKERSCDGFSHALNDLLQ